VRRGALPGPYIIAGVSTATLLSRSVSPRSTDWLVAAPKKPGHSALQTDGDIDIVAVNASVIPDDSADIDADAVSHTP